MFLIIYMLVSQIYIFMGAVMLILFSLKIMLNQLRPPCVDVMNNW